MSIIVKFSDTVRPRDRAIITGIIGTGFSRSVGLIAPFLVMPAMLKYLGDNYFGIWMTAISLTSMALFTDFGIGNGLLTRLSGAFGREDYKEMRAYISSAYAILGALSAVLLGTLAILHVTRKIPTFGFANSEAAKIILVCLGSFVIAIPISVIQRVMLACRKTWHSSLWQTAGSLVSVVFCLGFIYQKFSPWVVVSAYTLPPVFLMTLATVRFFMKAPELKPALPLVSARQIKDLLRVGKSFFLISVVTSIAFSADNIIISHRLSPTVVAEYAVVAKLASVLSLIITTLFTPLWAANGEALARRDYDWLRKTAYKMSLWGALLVSCASAVLIVFNSWIFQLWMDRQFLGQTEILMSFCFLSVFMAVASPFFMLLNGGGNTRAQIFALTLFLLISVGLKYVFASEEKLWLIPAISAVSYLVIVLPIVFFAARKSLLVVKSDCALKDKKRLQVLS